MAKRKDETKTAKTGRVSVIHIQGSEEERDWLTSLNEATHISKTTIVRLALSEWAKSKGLPPHPEMSHQKTG